MRLDTAGNWRSSLRAGKKDDKKINAYLLMYHVILTDLANGMPLSNDNEMPAFLMRCDLSRAS